MLNYGWEFFITPRERPSLPIRAVMRSMITTIESRNSRISTANLWFANKFRKEICRFLFQWYRSKKQFFAFCNGWKISREKAFLPFRHSIIIITVRGEDTSCRLCGSPIEVSEHLGVCSECARRIKSIWQKYCQRNQITKSYMLLLCGRTYGWRIFGLYFWGDLRLYGDISHREINCDCPRGQNMSYEMLRPVISRIAPKGRI